MPVMPHDSKTRFLEAALRVIRTKGYSATRIEDLCAAAGLTKGSFFYHFHGKEDMALAAADYWTSGVRALFERAPYQAQADPLDRLLGYVAFRKAILRGALPEFTCLAGTLVQETYDTHPAIRDACEKSISGHAAMVAKDIAEARRIYAPDASWTAESLALHIQAVLQGAFILAKARNGPEVAEQCVDHLRHYLELLFQQSPHTSHREGNMSTIRLHQVLRTAPGTVYRAFLDPDAMAKWLPPNGFTGRVHHLDARVGGTYKMSFTNFTTGRAETFGGKFLELVPDERIRHTDQFDDPNLPGEMLTTIALKKVSTGTEVTIVQEGIPEAIPPEMCYLGWQDSLTLLKQLVETEIPD